MKITISGATGFIGQYVTQHFSREHQLILLMRDKSIFNTEFKECEVVDLSSSDNEIKTKLEETEVYIHLAAKRPSKKISDQSFKPYTKLLEFSDRILNLLKDSNCKQIIHLSTKGVYGTKNKLPFTEDQIPYPSSLYGLSKLFNEQFFDQFGTTHQIPVCHFRLGQVLGWGETNRNLITVFLDNALKKQKQQIWGQGIGARSYIYIKDLIKAIELAVNSPTEGTYNISWPSAITHEEMARTINIVFENPRIEYLFDNPEDTSIEELNTNKAKKMLDWKPSYPTLEKALQDMKSEYNSSKK